MRLNAADQSIHDRLGLAAYSVAGYFAFDAILLPLPGRQKSPGQQQRRYGGPSLPMRGCIFSHRRYSRTIRQGVKLKSNFFSWAISCGRSCLLYSIAQQKMGKLHRDVHVVEDRVFGTIEGNMRTQRLDIEPMQPAGCQGRPIVQNKVAVLEQRIGR